MGTRVMYKNLIENNSPALDFLDGKKEREFQTFFVILYPIFIHMFLISCTIYVYKYYISKIGSNIKPKQIHSLQILEAGRGHFCRN